MPESIHEKITGQLRTWLDEIDGEIATIQAKVNALAEHRPNDFEQQRADLEQQLVKLQLDLYELQAISKSIPAPLTQEELDTYEAYCLRLEDPQFLAAEEYLAECGRIASEKCRQRLMELVRYEDGTWDTPLLTPDNPILDSDGPESEPEQ